MSRCGIFWMTAFCLAVTELFALTAYEGGSIASLWNTSPQPMVAILLMLVFGVLMPYMFVLLLWDEERRSIIRFALLFVAAATIVFGACLAIGASISFVVEGWSPSYLLGYVPLMVSLAALLARSMIIKSARKHASCAT